MSRLTTSRASVAVIGAGFSGLLSALHLLADPDGPQVRLIERRGVFGRGLAYSTDNPDHLLNVRVGNMSAFPDDPGHFVRWLSTHSGWSAGSGFVARGVYGEYLQSLLREAVKTVGSERLLLEADEAIRLERVGARWRIETAVGRSIFADAAILALGAPPPVAPTGLQPALAGSPRYVAEPWGAGAQGDLGDHVLLVGAGLTMVDVALSLSRPGRRFTVISRRGLTPRTHGFPARNAKAGSLSFQGSPVQVLRQVRRLTRERDWREILDAVRVQAGALWMSWPQSQRRAFLRHLRPWWDVHRHRLAPAIAHRLESLIEAGTVKIAAGSIRRLDLEDGRVAVDWRRRGSRRVRRITVDSVINCTGPGGALSQSRDPLVQRLLADDLIRPDPCGLGADVDACSRPLSRWGAPTPGLFAVGPLTRGAFWEISAVPDIRLQAQDVARRLLEEVTESQVCLTSRTSTAPSET